jgi:hypothetical protein
MIQVLSKVCIDWANKQPTATDDIKSLYKLIFEWCMETQELLALRAKLAADEEETTTNGDTH